MPAVCPVTVVIPAFNRRVFLEPCLQSVFKQSLLPQQVMVVDDGSSDATAEWVGEAFPKAQVIEQANRGVSAARNLGIQNATTEWIAFLDSDDRWLPCKLEKQMKALSENPEYRICHTEEKWILNGQERPVASDYRKQGGWIFEACLPRCAISPSTAVIHRTVFDEVGLFDETLPACEDYDLWLRIAPRMPVLLVDEALIEKHAGHPDQLSGQHSLDRYRIRALDKLLSLGSLSPEQEAKAKTMLILKCETFAKGLRKHGKNAEAKTILDKINKLQSGM
ncbi:MAG: glycosyltransferase family 2 protein [Verrucomicrobiae bacterium]|nr:glycosyltransferase family 2 protein [Verrucomicrobiae bacterium]